MALAVLYVTFGSIASARKVANALLSKRLIACVNIFSSESRYLWKGRACCTKEFVMFAKTTMANAKAARAEILSLHPYEIPCVIEFGAKANMAFAKWAKAETK